MANKEMWLPLLFGLLFSVVHAATPHSLHNLTSTDDATCQLSWIYQEDYYWMWLNGTNITGSWNITAKETVSYGFVLGPTADFNLLYGLTCMLASEGVTSQVPKGVFQIGANGPADPNIHFTSYYDAKGFWQIVPGVGENYFFVFS